MATRRKPPAKAKTGLFSGVIIGLVIGLAAAVATALFITQAPMPFMDKASRDIENILLPDVRHAPDPNLGLYGSSSLTESPLFEGKEAQWAKAFATAEPPPLAIPKPPAIQTPPADTLGNLIAQLPNPHAAPAPAPKPTAPKAPTPTPQKAKTLAAAPTVYYLQAGAFRSSNDAEAIRARILMLGLDANVQQGAYNGGTINRVRVGPFNGVDAMNQARATLGKEKIETSVVRP